MMNLPDSWQLVKLSDIALITMGQSPPSDSYNDKGEGIPLFQGKAEFGYINPIPVKWCTEPTKKAEKNDILMSIRAPVGPTNIANQYCCIGRGLASIRLNYQIAELKYIYWFLKSIEFSISQLGQGSTFKAINKATLEQLKIPLPPLEEQKRIAQILDKADEIRQKRKQAIQLTEELLKSTFLDMFGDPVINPKGWEVKKLGEICEKITDGTHNSPPITNEGIPYITAKHRNRK